ncbi:MAG TPA: hypothetical protein IAA53_03865 [Candidatus Avoscillospira avicola]|uniref:Uncharacterized protein n=1 Tax=Candidatus Avoscillospira avicola TaxID=2840706 RepID=A0A9D1DGY4_9FIRM|nr:hypothetical protein [Candidatus Avoscillospira avicola]
MKRSSPFLMDAFIILNSRGFVIGYFCIVFVKFSMARGKFHGVAMVPVEKLWSAVQNTKNFVGM